MTRRDRESSEKPTLRVVAAIIRREGADEVFAARRAPERSQGGLWEFPGGKVEPGETPEEALARELREELAVDAEVGAFADRSLTPIGDRIIELSCYDVRLRGAEPTGSTDHDAMTWLPVARLGELAWAPGDVPIVGRMLGS